MSKKDLPGSPVPVGTVGIACWINGQRRYFTDADWDERYKPLALGVYINTENTHIIYVSGSKGTSMYLPRGVNIPGVSNIGDAILAASDYAGKSHSEKTLAALAAGTITSAPAYTYARDIVVADGSIPFIPAAGQAVDTIANKTEWARQMREIGFAVDVSRINTSTSNNTYGSWRVDYSSGSLRNLDKDKSYAGTYAVIAID